MKKYLTILLTAAIVSGGFLLTGAYNPHTVTKWSYDFVIVKSSASNIDDKAERETNKKSNEGWELFDSDPIFDSEASYVRYMLVFRKPRQ